MRKSETFKDLAKSMPYLRDKKALYFISVGGMTVLTAVFSVVRSVAAKSVINSALNGDREKFTSTLIILMISLVAILVLVPLCAWKFNQSSKDAGRNIKSSTYDHMLKLPFLYFLKNHSGSIVSKLVNDSDNFTHLFGSRLRRVFAPLITAGISGIGLLFIDLKLGGALIILNTLSMFINIRFSAPVRKLSKQVQKNLSVLTEKVLDLFSGFLEVRLFDMGNRVSGDFADINRVIVSDSRKRLYLEGVLDSINYLLRITSSLGTVIAGAFLIAKGYSNAGTLVALISLQGRFSHALLESARNTPLLEWSLAGARNIYDFVDEPTEKERNKAIELDKIDKISIKNLSFSYDGENPVLRDISLEAEAGETIAFVGPSGSGKSTLFKIIAGLIDPTRGDIRYNDEKLTEIPREELWKETSYVSQSSILFDGSVEENIKAGNLMASFNDIEQAAISAAAHDFIMEQSTGYNTHVGERGIKLSGGQKQRIAIARSLIKKASLFMFDEATSSLDSKTEQLVQDSFKSNFTNGISFIIAHRLSTIQHADRIYVINNGLVEGVGTHTQLLESNELYRQLNSIQFE